MKCIFYNNFGDHNSNSNNNNDNFSEKIKYQVGIEQGIVCVMGSNNSSALSGSHSRDDISIKIPAVVN